MRRIIIISAAALASAACTYNASPEASARYAARQADKAAELDEALSGRTAGEPVTCVNARDLGGNRSYGEGAILFRGRTNSVVYVNRPPAGCPDLDYGRALKIRTPSTQICRGDIVTVFDPVSRVEYGGCGLGDFTPYRRAG